MSETGAYASDDIDLFFSEGCSSTFILTPSAAIEICRRAASRRLLVMGIEGGILSEGKFMTLLDSIWSGNYELGFGEIEEVHRNNLRAAEDIEVEKSRCNGFVLTVKDI